METNLPARDLAGIALETKAAGGRIIHASDFDGTLVPFHPLPDHAIPNPATVRTITRGTKVYDRVVIVTGRPASHVAPHFPDPNIDLYTMYGVESRIGGKPWQHRELKKWAPVIADVLKDLKAFLDDLQPGLYFTGSKEAQRNDALFLEITKPNSITIHDGPARSVRPNMHAKSGTYSRTPELLRRVTDALKESPVLRGLHLQVNNGNVELEAPIKFGDTVIDKATVMASIYRPRDLIIFTCDDTKDVPAANWIKDRGGIVLVVNNPPDAARSGAPQELIDLADAVFSSPEECVAYMNKLTTALEYEQLFEMSGAISSISSTNNMGNALR